MHIHGRSAWRYGAAVLLTGLASCGGGGGDTPAPDDPLAAYKSQTVAWAPCDPNVLGPNSALIQQLGDKVSCATIRAPLDYTKTDRGDIRVALLKVATADPKVRKGSIVFNPGGPGGDGLEMAANFGALFSQPPSDSPTRAALQDLARHYDMVGFSPRGTGAGTTLTCTANESSREVNFPSDDRSPANIEAMLYNLRLATQACQNNPLTPYINTEQTAWDLDLIRHLIGDAKLNYIGYSYGTWLGAWYAARFPGQAGHLLLDSAVDFTSGFDEAMIGQSVGKQRVLDEVMSPYFARHPDLFRLGADENRIRTLFGTLPSPLKAAVGATLAFNSSRGLVPSGFVMLAAGIIRDQLAVDPDMSDADLRTAVDTAIRDQAPFNIEAALRAATRLLDQFAAIRFSEPRSLLMPPGEATYVAVVCNDVASRTDPQYWIKLGDEMAISHPVTGGSMTEAPCLYWGGPTTAKPAVQDTAKAGPLMVVQSQFDALTLTENALRFVDALPTARLLYVKGEYSHGVFPYMSPCVDHRVTAFLLDDALPARRTDCDQVPFYGDVAAQGSLKRMAAPGQARTDALLDRIQEILAGAGKKGF